MPVRIQNIETVIKSEASLLTSLNLSGLGAMRALGANLNHLRRFQLTEALAIISTVGANESRLCKSSRLNSPEKIVPPVSFILNALVRRNLFEEQSPYVLKDNF